MAEPKPIRKQGSGAAQKIMGTLFLVAPVPLALLILAVADHLPTIIFQNKLLAFLLISLPVLSMCPIGGFLIWRGRQLAARASAHDIITSSKPHVLYLRPFRTDSHVVDGVFQALSPESVLKGDAFSKSEEEQLADVLRPFGDLIAIGKPGESLPAPGAARIYTSDDEWQDVVKQQIKDAQLVVISAALEENLLWELRQAIEILNPQKLLILSRNTGLKDYETFRARANSFLPIPLPEGKQVRRFCWRIRDLIFNAEEGSSWYWRVSGFISFDADWKPSFFPLTGPYLRSKDFRSRCKFALKPLFESRGLAWRRPRVSVRRVVTLVSVVSVVAIFLASVAGLVMSFLEDPTFPSQQHKEAFAQRTVTQCMSEIARRMGTRNPNILKMQFAKGCDCLASEVTNVIDLREVKALESGQVPSSYREKKEKAAMRCGVWGFL